VKVVPYLTPEQISIVYPKFDTWWRGKYHYFTLDPKSTFCLIMRFFEAFDCVAEIPNTLPLAKGNSKKEVTKKGKGKK